ncbi:Rv3235 family protein [Saccharomonospora azurea]|uniref:Uncharacterized protein n=1 Tax=Saccharomonospora azurea NA-128 TaxID=882081 RepID=H8GCC0_9PSEU|nr:Rv3235 family protein [Saccharomonospora azurea]EHK81449.1 hypothetical protein SZMC14600_21503 [Saccharomonospora azurea SZMC 14600]EHY88754.1 hypothetical protein SacazDRAFT_01836 [Saccharomonospora azurea NA-128]
MNAFTSASGLLPLNPYEPTGFGERSQGEVAEGQLSLDDLLAELHAHNVARHEYTLSAPGRRMLHRVLTALVEVQAGRRPASQLDGWLSPMLQRRLRARPRTVSTRYVLRNIHVCRPAEDALEVCGTAHLTDRAYALVARFEHGETGWRCTLFTVLGRRP